LSILSHNFIALASKLFKNVMCIKFAEIYSLHEHFPHLCFSKDICKLSDIPPLKTLAGANH